ENGGRLRVRFQLRQVVSERRIDIELVRFPEQQRDGRDERLADAADRHPGHLVLAAATAPRARCRTDRRTVRSSEDGNRGDAADGGQSLDEALQRVRGNGWGCCGRAHRTWVI